MPFSSIAAAKAVENGLPDDYYVYMMTGGTGQTGAVPDARLPNVTNLSTGPFQLTSPTLPYDSSFGGGTYSNCSANPDGLHDSAVDAPNHRRRAPREADHLGLLRRSVEH